MLGHGWYSQPSVNVGPPSLYLTLYVHFTLNGVSDVLTVVSDTTWTQNIGPIVMDDIYNGETYDSNLEKPGWNYANYDDSAWASAVNVAPPSSSVEITSHAIMPHVTIFQDYSPVQIWECAPGVWVFDFGQNMV